ncbi:MAG: hypothetical protein CMB32_07210 [Euryarchaeota archaeon]|nr:hypothetical protein [Euryarchaeota archaeon]|tara:strand:+ start:701 stop:871 length:171 start_codon:yes stop_codon:yes gene_type:complete
MASNAKEARHYIDTISPDVVFMDIQMPNESGLDVIEKYKERDFFTLCLPQHITSML